MNALIQKLINVFRSPNTYSFIILELEDFNHFYLCILIVNHFACQLSHSFVCQHIFACPQLCALFYFMVYFPHQKARFDSFVSPDSQTRLQLLAKKVNESNRRISLLASSWTVFVLLSFATFCSI